MQNGGSWQEMQWELDQGRVEGCRGPMAWQLLNGSSTQRARRHRARHATAGCPGPSTMRRKHGPRNEGRAQLTPGTHAACRTAPQSASAAHKEGLSAAAHTLLAGSSLTSSTTLTSTSCSTNSSCAR